MKFRKSLIGVLALAIVPMALNSVVFAQAPTVKVKIGVMGPFTGNAASIGTEQLNWAKLAVEDFNKSSGWSVELVQGDTELDAAKAVTVAASMIADPDIYAVVGPSGSQEVDATGAAFKEARLVNVSPSATRTTLTTSGFDTFFRVVPTDAAQGPTDGNFMAGELGLTKIFVIDDQTSYSTGLADEATKAFEAAGGTVVERDSVKQTDTDFSTLVTKAAAAGAEAIFFPGQIASQGAALGKAITEQGASIKIFAADGFFSVDDFIKGAAGTTEGSYISAFAPDIHKLDSSADVVKRYTDEYGDFGTFGPPTYAATTVILEAIERASTAGTLTRAAVRDEVAKTDQAMSVLGGPLAFDANGDVKNAAFYIFQVKGDNFELVPTAASMEATEEATSDMTMEATPEATP
ncbi:MAG: branched-chain amino acid ABC transporter substrate-binding protein [Chloroflexota bacterium]